MLQKRRSVADGTEMPSCGMSRSRKVLDRYHRIALQGLADGAQVPGTLDEGGRHVLEYNNDP